MMRATLRTLISSSVFLIGLAPMAAAQVATWEISGTLFSGNPLSVTTTATDVTAGDLSKSGALIGLNFANAFQAGSWPTGGIDLNDYLSFSVTADTGHQITYDRIEFSLYSASSGTSTWELRSSVDNFASTLDSGVATNLIVDGEDVSADITGITTQAGTVEFRLYTYDNTGSNADRRGLRGNPAGGIDLSVYGQVIVKPASLAEWVLSGTIDSSTPYPNTSTLQVTLASDLSKSASLTSENFVAAFMASDWPTGGIDLDKYMSFWVAPIPSFEITPSIVEFSIYNNSSGTADWEIRSSVDNYATTLSGGTVTNITADGQDVSADVSAVGTVPGGVQFRVYIYNNTGSNADRRGMRGTPQGGINLNVYGNVGPIGPQTFSVFGTWEYEDRLWDKDGYTGAVFETPVRHADVEVVDATNQTVIGTGSTDYNGDFLVEVTVLPDTPLYVRLLTSTLNHPDYHIAVRQGFGGSLQSVTTSNFSPNGSSDFYVGDYLIQDFDGFGVAQAFNILDCAVDGWNWLSQPQVLNRFPDPSEWVEFNWSPFGTSGGSYYFSQNINIAQPGSGDTDGWADAVILHEFGHYVSDVFHQDDSPGGSHFLGDNFQVPTLSYGEGYATYLAGEVREFRSENGVNDEHVSLYADIGMPPTVGTPGALEFSYDYETGLLGNGTPLGQIGQANETNVTSVLWDLFDGVGTDDESPGVDDDPLDGTGADVWNVLLNYMEPLPGEEVITLEDFFQGWVSLFGPTYKAAEIDSIVNGLNNMGFEDDAFEDDDLASQASVLTVPSYSLIGATGGVVINEVELGGEDGIELYNSSDTAVNIHNWRIVTSTNQASGLPHLEYTFPPYTLAPGAFVFVHERGNAANNSSVDLYGGSLSIPWINGGAGACELYDNLSVAVDFVRWDGAGDPSTTPVPLGLTWTGNVMSPPGDNTLGRDALGTDTDTASDWRPNVNSATQPNDLSYQQHTSYDVGDVDHLSLALQQGELYTVNTFGLLGAGDTYLEILDTDGSTVLASNDDRTGILNESRLSFVAPTTGTYTARVTHVGEYTDYGMYRIRAFAHPDADISGAPVSVLGDADNLYGAGDPVDIRWLNGSVYDSVGVSVLGTTTFDLTLPGNTTLHSTQLDQGVHTIAVEGWRQGSSVGTATNWVYAGLPLLGYTHAFENPALTDWTATHEWATTSSLSISGDSVTDSPGGNYDNNLDTSLELRVLTRLGTGGVLQFEHICITETDYDFGYVEISKDEGLTWDTIAFYDEEDHNEWRDGVAHPGDWKSESLSLAAYDGETIRVRFRLVTDGGVTRDGWYIDEISIQSTTTDVTPIAPLSTALWQNHPNPFNPMTSIRYSLRHPEHVQLHVFDPRGRLVRTLVDEPKPSGRHVVVWNGRDDRGRRVASGVYLYRMQAGAFAESRKFTLLK